jgi:hypothetical protein
VRNYVKVTLTIDVPVDAEYSPTEHADDIISNIRTLFPAAEVDILDVQTDQWSEPRLIAQNGTP